jgi:hypothetical protein
VIGKHVTIEAVPTDDNRSYHVSSELIKRELGFAASRTIEDAVCDLHGAFAGGRVPDAMSDDRYYNIKRMQSLQLR